MNRRLYAIHRWVSVAAFVQLAIWVATGFFFAVVPLKQVKGTPVEGAHAVAIAADVDLVPPAIIARKLAMSGTVDRIELVGTAAGPMYRGKVGDARFRVDARTGDERAVDEAEARTIASRDQPGGPAVLSATRVERDAHIEYRAKPLPAWRVVLADGNGTAIYVDAITGEVTARRNDLWRIYDFLWSLHIMDYRERESFNHPLLVGAASLGVLTVISGAVLWGVRFARWRRGRRSTRALGPASLHGADDCAHAPSRTSSTPTGSSPESGRFGGLPK